jgi:hypothetical protein
MISDFADGLLRRIGISPETARATLTVVGTEIREIGGDLLAATIEAKIRSIVRPQLLEMRAELLKNVAGDPPPGFAARLRSRGYNDISDLQIVSLWGDVIASIAEQPATSPAPAEEEAAAVA